MKTGVPCTRCTVVVWQLTLWLIDGVVVRRRGPTMIMGLTPWVVDDALTMRSSMRRCKLCEWSRTTRHRCDCRGWGSVGIVGEPHVVWGA
jgi:hypothetical protein